MRISLLYRFFLLCAAVAMATCSPDMSTAPPLFEKLPQETTGIDFMNSVQNKPDFNIFSYRNFYNGGGVAIGDINNDGLADIYFTHNTDKNRLYLNKGGLRFEDITDAAGVGGTRTWSTGVVMADINADGLLDIYVCNAGYIRGEDQQNELFINNGDLTFTEKGADYGLNEGGYTTHAAFFDYDTDGDLDVYILNNSFMPVNTLNYSNKRELKSADWPVRDFLKGGGDKLLRNDNGRYVDVTDEAGIYSSLIGFGLGITVGDVNGDHLPDMYVSNDFFERDYLYINNGDGTFREDIKNWIEHLSLFSMGADMADVNNDGYPEIFVTDMLPDDDVRLKSTSSFETYAVYDLKQKRDFYHQYMHNTLQLNNRDNTFSEIAFYSGVAASDWSWGALVFDMDNDGFRDIYVCNGIYQDVTDQDFIDFFANDVIQRMVLTGEKEDIDSVLAHMPSTPVVNKAFRNNGTLRFDDIGVEWGFDEPTYSNGAAYGDLDNDGDADLVINNLNQPAFVYENHSERLGRHFLTVQLRGMGANTFAVGSEVSVHIGDQILNSELIPSRGFQSSIDYRMHFGLGQATTVDSVVVIWPDLKRSRILQPAIDTILVLAHANATQEHRPASQPAGPGLLQEVPSPFVAHREDNFADFYYEGLLTKMLSREGPALAQGDVNGDGLEDLFIGGAAGQTARIYIQNEAGFETAAMPAFTAHADFEDTAAELFDADGDGDLDLYVGSGGNHEKEGTRQMHDRLYINDGTGTFTLAPRALPANGMNTAFAIAVDFDNDGDLDVITGSRNIPFNYGVDPQNYLFVNDGKGTFTEESAKRAPDFARCGLLTDATLADVMGDSTPELIVTGEWMAPRVFAFENGNIVGKSTSLDAHPGWWYAVAGEDLDNDGDVDLVLGNLGENFYLSASPEKPVKLWLADFDDNGTVENIVTRTVDGRDVPVALKKELTEQVVSLKKQTLKHQEYAHKSIQELFTPAQLEKAVVKEATHLSTMIAWNDGNGKFHTTALPATVQLSCVCSIVCRDVNGDGLVDILLAGNDYGFAPQFSRLDASFGHVLINSGDETLQTIASWESGFRVEGMVRNMTTILVGDIPHLIVAVNDAAPRIFRIPGKTETAQ